MPVGCGRVHGGAWGCMRCFQARQETLRLRFRSNLLRADGQSQEGAQQKLCKLYKVCKVCKLYKPFFGQLECMEGAGGCQSGAGGCVGGAWGCMWCFEARQETLRLRFRSTPAEGGWAVPRGRSTKTLQTLQILQSLQTLQTLLKPLGVRGGCRRVCGWHGGMHGGRGGMLTAAIHGNLCKLCKLRTIVKFYTI